MVYAIQRLQRMGLPHAPLPPPSPSPLNILNRGGGEVDAFPKTNDIVK